MYQKMRLVEPLEEQEGMFEEIIDPADIGRYVWVLLSGEPLTMLHSGFMRDERTDKVIPVQPKVHKIRCLVSNIIDRGLPVVFPVECLEHAGGNEAFCESPPRINCDQWKAKKVEAAESPLGN